MKFIPIITLLENAFEAESEMSKIGVDPYGIKLMKDKAVFYAIKLKKLTPPQANIIKQELLASGADAATAWGAINHSVKQTDILMFATRVQYRRLIGKLKENRFLLPDIGKNIEKAVLNFEKKPNPIKLKKRVLDFNKKTYIMGIVNVTPDSFSDGGKHFNTDSAVKHANELIKAGADIIDIGGESTRPGAKTVPEKEELQRVLPVAKILARNKKCLISVDTRKSYVAKAVLEHGADIINDVSALRHDKKMAEVIAFHNAAVVLMHMRGNPQNMQNQPHYEDIIFEVINYLKESIEIAEKAGILTSRIIIDPGFGFGKTLEHNLVLLRKLKAFKTLGRPILAGVSRKSMIGSILDALEGKRLIGTIAASSVAILNGANIIRTHDVFEAKQAAKIVDAIVGRKV